MKKIIISGLAIITLTSCWAPKIESPKDALSQNQNSLVENLKKTVDYYPENGNSKWDMNIDLETNEGKLNFWINYDWDYIQNWVESTTNLKIKVKANAADWIPVPVKEFSWNIDLNLTLLKKKFLFKLNSLNIDDIEKNP